MFYDLYYKTNLNFDDDFDQFSEQNRRESKLFEQVRDGCPGAVSRVNS